MRVIFIRLWTPQVRAFLRRVLALDALNEAISSVGRRHKPLLVMTMVKTADIVTRTGKRTIEKLLRQQAALADFGSFAFREPDLQAILTEAARICAQSLNVPFAKICRYRADSSDLVIVSGVGWNVGVIGYVVFPVDEKTTQGRAFVTGEPIIVDDVSKNRSYTLPAFYAAHRILSTVDVLIKGLGEPWGVLEVDSLLARTFDAHDVHFLTGFANVVAEAVSTAERTGALLAGIKQKQSLIVEKDRLLEERETREQRVLELQNKLLHVVRLNAMGEMTVAIAHELNQPLASITNYMGAAKRTLASVDGNVQAVADTRHLIDKTTAQAARAGKIIKDLRAIVEKHQSSRTKEDIGVIVKDSLDLVLLGQKEDAPTVEVVLDAKLPLVAIDKVQIQQILTNLIRNAIEAMLTSKSRGLVLTTSLGMPGFADVTVEDTGPGLPVIVSQQLFQPFVTTKTTGLGVGLMLCKTLVEVNGGRIWLQGNEPTGTSFRFSVPFAEATAVNQTASNVLRPIPNT